MWDFDETSLQKLQAKANEETHSNPLVSAEEGVGNSVVEDENQEQPANIEEPLDAPDAVIEDGIEEEEEEVNQRMNDSDVYDSPWGDIDAVSTDYSAL